MYRLGTDVGGTFTDGVLFDEATGSIRISKVPSTPHNPSLGTLDAIQEFEVPLQDVSFLVHGTTVVINTLIEGKGVKTALLTTKGFRDVLEIGRSNRVDMYEILYKKPVPMVPRYLRLEVQERMSSNGEVLIPLDKKQLEEILELLKLHNVEAVAVCLINSYANPQHEVQIGRYLAQNYPEAVVSLSHKITKRYYEYERTSTATQTAYVMPIVRRYLQDLEMELEAKGFQQELQIMQSNGGVMTSKVAQDIPIAMVESGPVAGAIGAAQLAGQLGYAHVISYDMGGTTAKTSLIREGLPQVTDQYLVEGSPILLPVVDIQEIGAGGGSIAWIDEGRALHVGPQSAGADPGPACYQQGGQDPTVTDANVELGILNPEYFLGGKMRISPEHARSAIAKIAEPFSMSLEDAALGIVRIVNTNMAGLLRSMTVGRGYDPREFALVAFGGSGPTHAAALAQELNIPTVIVPRYPGVFSAWGMLLADMRHDLVQTYVRRMDEVDLDEIDDIFSHLENQVRDLFRREGVNEDDVTLTHGAELRYVGQEHALSVSSPARLGAEDKAGLGQRFDELHQQVYGHSAPEEPKETVALKVTGIGVVKKPTWHVIEKGNETPPAEAIAGQRQVYLGNGDSQEFDIYRRELLRTGNVIQGPAIIEEATSTTVVLQGQLCRVDDYGNLILTVGEGKE